MPHHLYPAAVEALARITRIAEAGRADLGRMPQQTTRRAMERVVSKAEAQRDELEKIVAKLAAHSGRPGG